MIKAKNTKEIDEYLEGSLTDSEKLDFEAALNTDPQLYKEFSLHNELDNVLSDQKTLDFRAILVESRRNYKRNQKTVPKVIKIARKYRYAAASVILLLMIVGSILILSPRNYSNEQLFHKYYKPGDAVGITRSGNVNVVDAIMKFHNGEYLSACNIFDDVLQQDVNNQALRYYYGISCIEVKDYEKAEKLFKEIIDDGNNLYIEYAQWYLGLTYLVEGQNEKAIDQFNSIAENSEHYYNKDARELSEKIENSIKK